MTRLYLIRHGETEWNRDGNRYCGRSDIALSKTGKRQAEQAADWMASVPVDHIYASPLERAVDTAAVIASKHGLDVIQEEELREIDYGHWEGLVLDEIQQQNPDNWQMWYDRPDVTQAGVVGETAALVYNRYQSCIRKLCSRHHADARIVIVGHSAAIRIFLTGVLETEAAVYRKLVLHNTGVCVLETTEDKNFRLLQFNGKPDVLA